MNHKAFCSMINKIGRLKKYLKVNFKIKIVDINNLVNSKGRFSKFVFNF